MTHRNDARTTPPRAAVFDFDGTLADSQRAIFASMSATLAELSLPETSVERVSHQVGRPLHEALSALGVPDELLAHGVVRYRAIFPDYASEVRLFDGVQDCLDALAGASVPMAVASSRGRDSLHALLRQLGVHSLFASVLGEEDALRKKPAPDLVLALQAPLALPAEEMLVIGDTTYDIKMGQAAGAHTCAVTYGMHDAEALRAEQPTWLVDSLVSLPQLLQP